MNEDINLFYKISELIEGVQVNKSEILFNIDIIKKYSIEIDRLLESKDFVEGNAIIRCLNSHKFFKLSGTALAEIYRMDIEKSENKIHECLRNIKRLVGVINSDIQDMEKPKN